MIIFFQLTFMVFKFFLSVWHKKKVFTGNDRNMFKNYHPIDLRALCMLCQHSFFDRTGGVRCKAFGKHSINKDQTVVKRFDSIQSARLDPSKCGVYGSFFIMTGREDVKKIKPKINLTPKS